MPQDHHRNERRHRAPYRSHGSQQCEAKWLERQAAPSRSSSTADAVAPAPMAGGGASSRLTAAAVRGGGREAVQQHGKKTVQHPGISSSHAAVLRGRHHPRAGQGQAQPQPQPQPRHRSREDLSGHLLVEATAGALRQVLEDVQDSGGSHGDGLSRGYCNEEQHMENSHRLCDYGSGQEKGDIASASHRGRSLHHRGTDNYGDGDDDEEEVDETHRDHFSEQQVVAGAIRAARGSSGPASWGGGGRGGLEGSIHNPRLGDVGWDEGGIRASATAASSGSVAYPDPRRYLYHSSSYARAAAGAEETVEELRRVRQSQAEIIYMLQDKLRDSQFSIQDALDDNRHLREANEELREEVRRLHSAAAFRIETRRRGSSFGGFGNGLGNGDDEDSNRGSTEDRDEDGGDDGQQDHAQYGVGGRHVTPHAHPSHNSITRTTVAVLAGTVSAASSPPSDRSRERTRFHAGASRQEGLASSSSPVKSKEVIALERTSVRFEDPRSPSGSSLDMPRRRGHPSPRHIVPPSSLPPAISPRERLLPHKRQRSERTSPSPSGDYIDNIAHSLALVGHNHSNALLDDSYATNDSMPRNCRSVDDPNTRNDERKPSARTSASQQVEHHPTQPGSCREKAVTSRPSFKHPDRKPPPPSMASPPLPIRHTSCGVLESATMSVGAQPRAASSPGFVASSPGRSTDLMLRPLSPQAPVSVASARKRRRQPQGASDGTRSSSCLLDLFSARSGAGRSDRGAAANAAQESSTVVVEGSDPEQTEDEASVEKPDIGDDSSYDDEVEPRKPGSKPSSGGHARF